MELLMNVLITGAGGGLGGAVCAAFESGRAKVIAVDRNWKEPKPYITFTADLMTGAGCDAMVKQAL